MKQRLLALLLLVALCMGAVAAAAEQIPDSFPPQQIECNAFTLSIDYDWVLKELTEDDASNGLLMQADRADGSQTLMIFKGGEGELDDILEMTARNEYAGLEKREGQQTYNNIQIVFTTSEENKSASAYISIGGTIYSFLLTEKAKDATMEKTTLETLQNCLISLIVKP